MASSKEYLDFILGQLCNLDNISYKAMMGEFILYYRGKNAGGIFDNRLLVKPVESAISYMPNAPYELPYVGAKEMLLVDDADNKEYLQAYLKCCIKTCLHQNPKRRNRTNSDLSGYARLSTTDSNPPEIFGGLLFTLCED